MQVALVCILCELLPLVDLKKSWLIFFVHPRNLCNGCVYEYNFSPQPSQLVQPINAEIVTLVCILCELWPLMDLHILDKAYHTVTTTIFLVKKPIVERAVLRTDLAYKFKLPKVQINLHFG